MTDKPPRSVCDQTTIKYVWDAAKAYENVANTMEEAYDLRTIPIHQLERELTALCHRSNMAMSALSNLVRHVVEELTGRPMDDGGTGRPVGGEGTGRPVDDECTGRATGDELIGHVIGSDAPDGDTSDGDASVGDTSDGDIPGVGDTSSGDTSGVGNISGIGETSGAGDISAGVKAMFDGTLFGGFGAPGTAKK